MWDEQTNERVVCLLQQGVIVLSDNDPDAHYFYLVTVITGWKSGAGTTSTVGMCMIGSQGTSARHLLEDPHRLVHEKGSDNWFLVATTRVLGDLRTVRVWHSCSGLFPSWYGINHRTRQCYSLYGGISSSAVCVEEQCHVRSGTNVEFK